MQGWLAACCMVAGPPLPLRPDLPLRELVALGATVPGTLGVWLRGVVPPMRLCAVAHGQRCQLLLSGDLGLLLGRCSRVAIREARRPLVLEANEIIHWRALQVVTGAPHLPSLERLAEVFPGARIGLSGFSVPLPSGTPEEVLADCVAHEIEVKGSRIVYQPSSTQTRPPSVHPCPLRLT